MVQAIATKTNLNKKESNMENWCEQHQTQWFMKGRMKSFAHPIKDGETLVAWCNRPQDWEEPEAETPALVKEAVKELGGEVSEVTNAPKPKTDPTNRRIAKAVALKAAVDLAGSGCINRSEIISTADSFTVWLEER